MITTPVKFRSHCLFICLLLLATGSQVRATTWLSVQGDLGKVSFDEDALGGSVSHIGLTLALAFDENYEFGFSYSGNLDNPSLDDDNAVDADEVSTSAKLLYLRRNWDLSDKTTAFALLGYAQLDIKAEDVTNSPSLSCFLVLAGCFDFSRDSVYENDESGYAWGIGIQYMVGHSKYLMLQYLDYSLDGFDFSGVFLSLRKTFIFN
jgi:opacity protein-like surface antigen